MNISLSKKAGGKKKWEIEKKRSVKDKKKNDMNLEEK